MTRRAPQPRAYAPDPRAPGHACDLPGCLAAGEYRAPKSRSTLTEYWWFCLEHVRAYNASWDFYRGMTPGQIEAELRADTAWQRPSWPLGRLGGVLDEETLRDPLHVLDAGRINGGRMNGGRVDGGRGGAAAQAPADLRGPLSTLGLDWPITLEQVKARYKVLAKRHHPDANGGDRAAEERLKTINLAYAAVRERLVGEPRGREAG